MKKKRATPSPPFYFKEISERPNCPLCGEPAKVVVPSIKLTYIVHAVDKVCVLGNADNLD